MKQSEAKFFHLSPFWTGSRGRWIPTWIRGTGTWWLYRHSHSLQRSRPQRRRSLSDHYRERIEQTTEDESIEHLSNPGTPRDRADSNSRGGERSDVLGKIVQKLQLASGEDRVLLLSLEKDNLALLQQGEVLEQEIYNDLIHQWPQTPAQKPMPNKAKRNSSLFFRFFHFFFRFFSLFSLF